MSGLNFQLAPKLKLTPEFKQAFKLLQMSQYELSLEILSNIETNPLLSTSKQTEEKEAENKIQEGLYSEVQSEKYFNRFIQPLFQKQAGINPVERIPAPFNFQAHLELQLNLCIQSDRERFIGLTLCDSIDETGYLNSSLEGIQESLRLQNGGLYEISEIEEVLSKIQHFDPIGVGARDLRECLLIQLNNVFPDSPVFLTAKRLILNYLALLAKRDYSGLQTKLNVSERELEEAIHLLLKLNPKPGHQFTGSTPFFNYIQPDLYVEKKNGEYQVRFNKRGSPHLYLNRPAEILEKNLDQNQQVILKYYFKEAQHFLRSLDIRKKTLLLVAKHIIQKQKDFLEKGPAFLKGLVLQDIANETKLHLSTVWRASTQKYIETPQGVFELSYFFSSKIETRSGQQISSNAIRATIEQLIKNEIPENPLSDIYITEALKEKGIILGRRAVTKYRESLKIPSSHVRRRSSSRMST